MHRKLKKNVPIIFLDIQSASACEGVYNFDYLIQF